MDEWDAFYALFGLIIVVITLGMEQAREGDTDRTRLFVTPSLVYSVSLLIISLAMIPPLSETTRTFALGVIDCAGLGYTINLALMLRRLAAPEEIEPTVGYGTADCVLCVSRVLGGGVDAQSPIRRCERPPSRSCSSPRCARARW